ncbi:MAG: SDR family NAD(P)-dependent oxidoreductase [Cyclobacteriaceae bacterium]
MTNLNLVQKYGPWVTVTGASSGIGRAFALKLARQGFNVHITGRNQQSLADLKEQLKEQTQILIHTTIADLSTDDGIERLINDANTLDVGLLVHAAGAESHGAFNDGDINQELSLLDLNIRSTYRLAHHFSEKFVSRGKGGILLVSSLTGHFHSPYFANYASSKSYVLTLGNSLHHELKSKGVDVSVLSPGLTYTPMYENIAKDIDWSKTPMKASSPEFVVEYALKSFPRKVNIIPGTGNRISAVFGQRILPRFFGKQNESLFRKAMKAH